MAWDCLQVQSQSMRVVQKFLGGEHELKQDRGSHRNFRPATGSVRGEGAMKTQRTLQVQPSKSGFGEHAMAFGEMFR